MRSWRTTGVVLGLVLGTFASLIIGTRALLVRQAAIARARIGKPLGETSIDADRLWRKSLTGDPIKLLLLGDSLAAGLGAGRRKETLGGRLSKALARATSRPVYLRTAAVVGSESQALTEQLDSIPADYRADVAVIVVGGNDVTHMVPPETAARHLEQVISRIAASGTAVVVGTCPDLGTLQAVPQPLRSLLSRRSKRMAAAQNRVALRAGALSVSLGIEVGPVFRAEPEEMFSVDRFHPSAAGYRRTAEALLPAIIAALRSDEASPHRVARVSRDEPR